MSRLPAELLPLIDPDERDHAADLVASTSYSDDLAETLRELIVEPLRRWIDAEYLRLGFIHESAERAGTLARAADDIAYRYRHAEEVLPEHADVLRDRWTDWLASIASDTATSLHAKRQVNQRNAKGPRADFDMIRVEYDRFVDLHGGKTRGAIAHVARKLKKDRKTVMAAIDSRK